MVTAMLRQSRGGRTDVETAARLGLDPALIPVYVVAVKSNQAVRQRDNNRYADKVFALK